MGEYEVGKLVQACMKIGPHSAEKRWTSIAIPPAVGQRRRAAMGEMQRPMTLQTEAMPRGTSTRPWNARVAAHPMNIVKEIMASSQVVMWSMVPMLARWGGCAGDW